MAEQASFQIPTIEERDDLVLADAGQEVWTPGSINAAAARAAKVAHLVLGVEEKGAEDTFTGQLEAMGLTETPEGLVPVVSVAVGAKDENGRAWTPSHVVKGHDKLTTKSGDAIRATAIWSDMYANRPAEWWNKTRPEGESQLVKTPLRLVLADVALRGTNKKWDGQQAELQKLVDGHSSDTATLEGMAILDWEMMDADAIIGDIERPDEQTVTRFVQHERDRSDAGGAFGPVAYVLGDLALLLGWRGGAYPDRGFRAVMGQKQAS